MELQSQSEKTVRVGIETYFIVLILQIVYALISHNLIFPCSFATASISLLLANATAVILPNGVWLVGQFL